MVGLSSELENLTSSSELFNDLGITLIFLIVLCVFLLVLGVCMICPKVRAKITQLLAFIKKIMIWNGMIDTITIGYLNYCLTWWNILTEHLTNDENSPSAGYIIMYICIGLSITIYPCLIIYTLKKYTNNELNNKEKN